MQRDAPLLALRAERLQRPLDHALHVHVLPVDLDDAGLDPADVQHVVDHPAQTLRLVLDDLVELAARRLVLRLAVDEHLHVGADGGERRPQLVAGLGHEVALHLGDLALPRQVVQDRHDAADVALVIGHAEQRGVEDPGAIARPLRRTRGHDLVLDVAMVMEVGVGPGVGDETAQAAIRDELVQRLVDRPLEVEPEDLRCRPVGHDDFAVRVGHEDRVAQRVEDDLDLPAFRLGDAMADLQVSKLVSQPLLAQVESVHRADEGARDREQERGVPERAVLVVPSRPLDVSAQAPHGAVEGHAHGHDHQGEGDRETDADRDQPEPGLHPLEERAATGRRRWRWSPER